MDQNDHAKLGRVQKFNKNYCIIFAEKIEIESENDLKQKSLVCVQVARCFFWPLISCLRALNQLYQLCI